MKHFKKIYNTKTLLLLVIILLPTINLLAQSEPGTDPDVPLDGGLSLLVAAGVGYGAKRLKNKTDSGK